MMSLPDSSSAPECDVNEIIRVVVHSNAQRWKDAGVALRVDLAEHLPPISMNPQELEQILLVLCANAEAAINANPEMPGQIQLRSALLAQRVQITLSDNGRGLHSREMLHLFDREGRDTELTCCAEIINDRGGELYAWSKFGKGSAFTIDFPVPTIDDDGFYESIPGGSLTGKRILVIDDEIQIAALMFDLLQQQGAAVDVANSGLEGVRCITSETYDLFICDHWMPDLTGELVYRRIESTKPELLKRFLFVTGDVLDEGADQFLRQSGVPYVRKPFRMAELLTAVEEVLNRNRRFDS